MRKVLTVAVAALLLLVSAHAEDNPVPKLEAVSKTLK